MRVFVTGASGWIGSGVVPALQAAGHEVLGLARSDRAASAVEQLGAQVHRGDLADLDSLRRGAGGVGAVVHLGYHHDFSQLAEAARLDRNAIEVFGDVLAGTDAALVVAAGVLGVGGGGEPASERDRPDPSVHPRAATGAAVLALAERGVRSSVVRFAPTVHGAGDRGFVATLTDLARRTGFAGYVDDGSARWPAVHRDDAAELVALAVEAAAPASVLHAVAEEGIPTREIAEAIGTSLGVPPRSVPAVDAAGHFGWIGRFFGLDAAASNALTREQTGWTPTHPGLLADLAAGHYVDVAPNGRRRLSDTGYRENAAPIGNDRRDDEVPHREVGPKSRKVALMSAPSPVELGQSYFELHHRIHRLVDEAMNAAGLSLSRAKVLGVLAAHGPTKQATVACRLGFAPRSVTDTLDALEREGLATRNPDPNDRRARLVEITPAGRTALDRAVVAKRSAMNTLFGGLDDADRSRFADLLAAIQTQLDSNAKVVAHVS